MVFRVCFGSLFLFDIDKYILQLSPQLEAKKCRKWFKEKLLIKNQQKVDQRQKRMPKMRQLQQPLQVIIVQQKSMISSQNKKGLRSRKQSLTLQTQMPTSPQQPQLAPITPFSRQQQSCQLTPLVSYSSKHAEETSQKTETSCQNHFLRKTILTLFSFFERIKQQWTLQKLSYKQMTLILKELRYIKFSSSDSSPQNSQQQKKCYYLWLNLCESKYIKLSNLIIILCHVEHLGIDSLLIEDIVNELAKGIDKFNLFNDEDGLPVFIFLSRRQNWEMKNGLIVLTGRQVKSIQNQLNCFKYTRLTQNNPKIELEDNKQEQNPIFPMSKKSIELAQNKRSKILKDIQKTGKIETIELYHILSYKKQIGKYTVSKIQQGFIDPPKKKVKDSCLKKYEVKGKNEMKKKVSKKNKVLNNKENKVRNNGYKGGQNMRQRKISDEIRQITDSLDDDLGISQITRTQILEQIDFNTEEPHFEKLQTTQYNTASSELHLPQSLLQEQNPKEKKRRQYIDLPILYVDVNIQDGKKERIVVYEGDTAQHLSIEFGKKHNLPYETVEKLQALLAQQIGSILHKIDENLEQEESSYIF